MIDWQGKKKPALAATDLGMFLVIPRTGGSWREACMEQQGVD